MAVAKQKTVNPQVEIDDPGDAPITSLEAMGLAPQEVVVGTESLPPPAFQGIPTVKIRVNRTIENMSHVGALGAEHFSFEQGHEYENVPIYIALELERIGAVWH